MRDVARRAITVTAKEMGSGHKSLGRLWGRYRRKAFGHYSDEEFAELLGFPLRGPPWLRLKAEAKILAELLQGPASVMNTPPPAELLEPPASMAKTPPDKFLNLSKPNDPT
jgi:hypothetical protein